MEAFFIQKRFLLSAVRPELMLKEENLDLRLEISRKDDLIRKHYERIESWKMMLSEQHPSTHQQLPNLAPPPPPAALGGPSMSMGSTGDIRGMPMGSMGGMSNMQPGNQQGPMVGPMGGMPNPMQVCYHISSMRAH